MKQTLQQFIKKNKKIINSFINNQNGIGSCSVCGKDRIVKISDRERELWVRNTESLYLKAQSAGVDFS